jgi:hypothetical protein
MLKNNSSKSKQPAISNHHNKHCLMQTCHSTDTNESKSPHTKLNSMSSPINPAKMIQTVSSPTKRNPSSTVPTLTPTKISLLLIHKKTHRSQAPKTSNKKSSPAKFKAHHPLTILDRLFPSPPTSSNFTNVIIIDKSAYQ